jgi:stage II sporulation protein D
MVATKRILTTLLAAGALLAPAAADAAWRLDGRGFGHGVGLSQYGAYGFAKHGKGYRAILDHYYANTKLGKTGGEAVRVLLGQGSGSIGFTGASRACGRRLNANAAYAFATAGAGVELRKQGGGRITGCGNEGKATDRVIKIEGHGRYRGSLVARASSGGLMAINQLPIESYVKGVVANEAPSSWPANALRAQAVVARSYGIATERTGPFDHYADTRSQVYGGLGSETKATNRAVEDTSREVVEYRGKTAVTYYFSTSGGRTEDSQFGFSGGSEIAYLKSVKDPYDDTSPVHTWRETLSDEAMESKLSGLFSGKLQRIEVIETGRSPRVVRARVVGSSGSQTVTGDTLRARLGLRSTWVKFAHR